MKTWDEVVRDALNIYHHRDQYVYVYGAKGIRITPENYRYLVEAEHNYFYSKYTNDQIYKEIMPKCIGKIAYDCSGFISAITGCATYSTAIISQCTEKTNVIRNVPAGGILYTSFNGTGRHVALDMGYGYSLSFDKDGESCMMHKHSEKTMPWEIGGKLTNYIDYTGADNR